MKSNQISIFIVLILSVVIGGLLYFLERSSDEDLGWSPNEMYGELGARSYDGSSFTNATLSGASNGGVALSMPHTSFSLRTRVSPTTYSPLPISNSQSPIANGPSPIAYMTSGAEYRSFGGGGNGNMGSAGTFRASAQSPIANSQSPIAYTPSPIAYSPSPISNTPSPISNTPATVASGNNPAGLFSYALQTSYGTASYEAMNYYANNGNRINNRFNAPPGMSGEEGDDDGSAYESWLHWMSIHGWKFGTQNGDNTWDYDNEATWNAFLVWYKSVYGKDYKPDDPMTPPEFTYEEWLKWFTSNGGSHNYDGWTFNFTPVGDVLPLIILAILYAAFLIMKRRVFKTINS